MTRMSRRCFLASAAGCAVTGAGAFALRHAGGAPRKAPNVIFAFSDEHRSQSMSFTEMPKLQTPHMARMAEEGISFTSCISNYPVCSPYRAMLMTGRWPYQQGVIDNGIPLQPGEETLGKVFQEGGYRTAYIGKWHLGGLRAEPFGFDHSLIWENDNAHWNQGRYHPKEGPAIQPEGYNATLMTNQAIEFVRAHRRDHAQQPFLLTLSWNPPHANFLDAPEGKKALYPFGSLPPRQNAAPWPADPGAAQGLPGAPGATAPIWRQNDWAHFQGYHAHISAIDDELGRLLDLLDALGIAEDTLLIYTADHGSMMGSHGLGGKRQPYEESIGVPFIARWPGVIERAQRSDRLMGTIDLVPTLCGLAGLDPPSACTGHDFSSIFQGRPGPDPEAQFIMHISKKNASGGEGHPAPLFRGVRTKRYTYAELEEGAGLLFDNVADPYQQENLFEDPSSTAIRQELHATTQAFLRAAHDPFVSHVAKA